METTVKNTNEKVNVSNEAKNKAKKETIANLQKSLSEKISTAEIAGSEKREIYKNLNGLDSKRAKKQRVKNRNFLNDCAINYFAASQKNNVAKMNEIKSNFLTKAKEIYSAEKITNVSDVRTPFKREEDKQLIEFFILSIID